MKKKLFCVEYSPNIQLVKGSKLVPKPFSGYVGETRTDVYAAAIRDIQRLAAEGRDTSKVKIPVRFPLVGAGSKLTFWMNGRDPENLLDLVEEGEQLSPYDLHPTKDMPVSYYEKCKLTNFSQLFELFRSNKYVQTRKITEMKNAFHALRSKYPHVWAWKLESTSATRKGVLFECNFYGANTVIATYDQRVFSGVAVEIVIRPWPTPEEIKQGVRNVRTCSDLILFTTTEQYVSSIDGVSVSREKVDANKVIGWYNDLTQQSNVMQQRQLLFKKSNATAGA